MAGSKNKDTKQKKSKKPVTDDILKNLGFNDDSQQEQSQPKRRLRKQRHESEEDQEFVPNRSQPQQQDLIDQIHHQSQKQQKFQRFNIKDDQDLKKQQQEKQMKKKSKKLKGNQEIDKFISDNNKNQKKQKKKAQIKTEANPNTQLTLQAMFNLKKIKKPKKISSQQQFQEPIQEQIDQDQLVRKRLFAQKNLYQSVNGSLQDERDLLQKAKKLSLQSAKKQKLNSEDNLDSFKFENRQNNFNKSKTFQQQLEEQKAIKQKNKKFESSEDDQPYKRKQLDEKKADKKSHKKKQPQSQSNQEEPNKRQPSKNKKSKKVQKQKKQGPLADETIVFTGQFQPYGKDQLVQLCQKLGANTPKSFAVKTTILLQGAYVVDQFKRKSNQPIQTTGKSKQALQKGIRIVPNADLDDFFLQKTGKSLAQHFQKNRLDTFAQREQPAMINMDIEVNPQSGKDQKKTLITDTTLWTQKYKPNSLQQVLGQHKQIQDIRLWLIDWQDVHFKGNKKQVKGQRGFLPTGTINSKAALLSGDPGLGKTTTARLLGVELGYNIVQFNASDIRNKKGVKLLQSNSLGLHSSANLMKTLIIMDQVDGMSSGDRGGITQIIMMIKSTKVPIICICNDRQSQKIRSLAGHCFDIRFHRPDKRLIIKRLHQIVAKQHGKASDLVLSRIVETFQNDMRQILNYLELLMKTKTKQLQIKMMGETDRFSKDSAVMLTHFDAARKLLNRGELDRMRLRDRLDCYFIDSDMVPLMVHENYLGSMKKDRLTKADFHNLVKATEGFVLGDILDRNIRKEQDYSLMPAVGYMTCVYPTEMVSASFGFPQFPSWLGKFSSERKQKRLIKQLKNAMAPEITGGNRAVKYHYSPMLFRQIHDLLKHQKIQETVDMMQIYGLTPDSLNQTLIGMQYNPSKSNLMGDISASTKTKLTKLYKKKHEQLRLMGKAKKGSGSTMQHHKYNPILQDLDDDDVIAQQQQEQKGQQQEVVEVVAKKDTKKKGGKK